MEPKKAPANFDQNPFMDLMESGGQGGPQMGPGMMAEGPMAPSASTQPQMGPDGQPIMPDALQPGKTGDNSRPLLGAISQLHQFIAGSTSPEEIQMVRQIVTLLTNLIARDQQNAEAMMMNPQQPPQM